MARGSRPGFPSSEMTTSLLSWLEELDWIAVGIFDLDLSAEGTSLHLIAKLHPRVLQRVDLRPADPPRAGPLDSIRPAAGIRRRASGEIPMLPAH